MDRASEVFCSRVRSHDRRGRGYRRSTGAASDTHSPSPATDLQSVESKHCTANGGPSVSPKALPGPGAQGNPSFCGVFHRGPCLPQYLPPIGQDLRLTIVSTDHNDSAGKPGEDSNTDGGPAGKAEDEPLDSIREMYAALRACWIPPPIESARHGMEYTVRFAFKRDGKMIAPPRVTYSSHDAPAEVRDVYRDAVNAALARCMPLHFSNGMGGAVAGAQSPSVS